MSREQSRFVTAEEVQDALRADHLQRALEAAGIASLVQERGGGMASGLTGGLTRPWWEVRVPEADLERARALVAAELQALEAHAAEDAHAAEAEVDAQVSGDSTSSSA